MDEVTFTFVIPAHNEAAILADTVTQVVDRLQSVPGSEVLIVENGSTDTTWDVASELARRGWGDVAVRALRSEPGLAPAYRMGAAHASGDHVVFTAADLPFGFTDLDAFSRGEPSTRPSFAIGSKGHPDSVLERSVARRLMSGAFYLVRMGFLGGRVRDPQGSLIVSRSVSQRLVPATEGAGFVFGTELAALAQLEGITPVELPVTLADERRASTVRPLRDSWAMLRGVVQLRRRLDAEADRRALERLAEGTEPGPFLRRLVPRASRGWPLLTAVLAGVMGVALLATGLLLSLRVLEAVLVDRMSQPGVGHALALAAITAAIVVVSVLAVRRLLARAPVAEVRPAAGDRIGVSHRRGYVLAAAAASAAAAVLGLWRVLPDLSTVGIGSGDARYWYWIGWRIAEQVRAGDVVPGGIPSVVWPTGYSLWPADGALPAAVGAFWNLLVSDPTLAYNLAAATAIVTTTVAGVRLGRTLGADPWLAAVAGVAVGTAPALAIRLEGHYNLLFAFPAILIVDVALRHVLRGGSPFPIVRTAVLLVLAYVSSGYYLLFGVVVLVVVLAMSGRPARWVATSYSRLAVAGLLALLVLTPFLLPKLQLERTEADHGATPMGVGGVFASPATSVLIPPDGTMVDLLKEQNDTFGPNVVETTAFVGALGLFGLGALCFIRSPISRPILAATGALYLLSLGPTVVAFGREVPPGLRWLPVTLLLELPGFAGMRAVNRASFVLAPLAIGAAVVVLAWGRRRSPRAGAAAVLALAVVLVAASLRIPTNSAAEVDGDLQAALLSLRVDEDAPAVIHLPNDCMLNIDQVEMQIEHRRPLVGCQGFQSAIPWRSGLGAYAASRGWAALRCEPARIGALPTPEVAAMVPTPEAVRLLRDELGVGAVVFDRSNLCPERGAAILEVLEGVGTIVGGDERFVVVTLPDVEEGP